jgi:membrane-bound serine protease (ClpP class)
MILGLYAFNAITVSMAGLMLMIAAVIMFVMEVKIISHGALTVGGVIAFFLGSLMLFSPHLPTFRISLGMVGLMSVLMMGFFMFVVAKGLAAQNAVLVSGRETLAGALGEAHSDITKWAGRIHAAGEEWSAFTEGEPIPAGAQVRIVTVEGNRVKVIKV